MVDRAQQVIDDLAAIRMREVEHRFGDRLDVDQRAKVETRIATSIKNASALRDVPLKNGDEPAFVFLPGGTEQ